MTKYFYVFIFNILKKGSQILGEDRIFHDVWFQKSTKRLLELIKIYSIPGLK